MPRCDALFMRKPTLASIAHEQPCNNQSMPSTQAKVPASQACTGWGGWELGNYLVLRNQGKKISFLSQVPPN